MTTNVDPNPVNNAMCRWKQTNKQTMVQAQYCSEWTELWYGTFQGSIPLFQDNWTRVVRVYYPLLLFIIDWILMFVKQTQVGADLRLEVNKCAFTFAREIRQIQCTRTEFWCVQCPRPAGPSALDKHQIQASALDLSYFTSKSKCKFINLIHTRQKNKIIWSRSRKIINKMVLKCH